MHIVVHLDQQQADIPHKMWSPKHWKLPISHWMGWVQCIVAHELQWAADWGLANWQPAARNSPSKPEPWWLSRGKQQQSTLRIKSEPSLSASNLTRMPYHDIPDEILHLALYVCLMNKLKSMLSSGPDFEVVPSCWSTHYLVRPR